MRERLAVRKRRGFALTVVRPISYILDVAARKTTSVTFRAFAEMVERWRAEADAAGITLSAYITLRCNGGKMPPKPPAPTP